MGVLAKSIAGEAVPSEEMLNSMNLISAKGQQFWLGFIRLLLNGKSESRYVQWLVEPLQQLGLVDPLGCKEVKNLLHGCSDRVLEQVSKDLDTAMANLVVGKLQNLKAHFFNVYGVAVDEALGVLGLDIPDRFSIFKFWKINASLPDPDQWQFVPQGGFQDKHLLLSEESLLGILKPCLGRDVWTSFKSTLMTQQGRLIESLFGNAPYPKAVLPFFRNSQDGTLKSPNVLNNTILTDGLVLKVHFMNTTKKKIKNAKIPYSYVKDYDYLPDVVCGVDLGKTFAFAACSMEASQIGEIKAKTNLAIRSRALDEPSRLHRSWLQQRKIKHGHVLQWERDLAFRNGETTTDFLTRWLGLVKDIHAFYNTTKMKKRRWDLHRATRALYNKVVDACLKMNGASLGRKRDGQDRRLVFAIGDSQFGYGTNTAIEKYFVSKVFYCLI